MKPDFRKRLFAVQQRIAITGGETLAILGFAGIMAVGGLVIHFDGNRSRVDTSAYPSFRAAVEAGAALSVEEALAALPADTSASPEASEVAPAVRTQPPAPPRAPVRLDPNTASSQLLQRLPGIGPALAGRIIEHRELHGPFRSPRDVIAVRGIGPKTFERLEPYLEIAAPSVESVSADTQSTADAGGTGSASSGSPSPL